MFENRGHGGYIKFNVLEQVCPGAGGVSFPMSALLVLRKGSLVPMAKYRLSPGFCACKQRSPKCRPCRDAGVLEGGNLGRCDGKRTVISVQLCLCHLCRY